MTALPLPSLSAVPALRLSYRTPPVPAKWRRQWIGYGELLEIAGQSPSRPPELAAACDEAVAFLWWSEG